MAREKACFKVVASHSAAVTSKGNAIVWAWMKEPVLSRKHIPVQNFLVVLHKAPPTTLHFSHIAGGFDQVISWVGEWDEMRLLLYQVMHHIWSEYTCCEWTDLFILPHTSITCTPYATKHNNKQLLNELSSVGEYNGRKAATLMELRF
jgi:hypothetical protein